MNEHEISSICLWCSLILTHPLHWFLHLGGNFSKTSSTMSLSNSESVLAYEKENKELHHENITTQLS